LVTAILALDIFKLGLFSLLLLSSFGLLLFGPKSLINTYILIVVVTDRYQIVVLLEHVVVISVSCGVLHHWVGVVASDHLVVFLLLRLVVVLVKVVGNCHTHLSLDTFACHHALRLANAV